MEKRRGEERKLNKKTVKGKKIRQNRKIQNKGRGQGKKKKRKGNRKGKDMEEEGM